MFVGLVHFIEALSKRWIDYAPLRPLLGGLLLIALYLLEGSYQYLGLGMPVITKALLEPTPAIVPILKGIFTAITIGTGFKGGDFIPLVFIGTTLGSALAGAFPVSIQLMASVGFAAVFAGATQTPIACSVMAIELFGGEIAPYVVVACFISSSCSAKKSR
jgi:H+/Cl- antiporter ClcA